LNEINDSLPQIVRNGNADTFIEPFVGSGAVLFYVLENYSFQQVHIYDVNKELINIYEQLKINVGAVVEQLELLEKTYLPADSVVRKEFYYDRRKEFNELKVAEVQSQEIKARLAALMIFLNRTCFNGLYRVNKKGLFNVPMGNYAMPTICNKENLFAVSEALQNVTMSVGDYKLSEEVATAKSFVYFDPPYRPLNASSSFTSYSEFDFTDEQQKELATYYRQLDKKGCKLMLSNSDPKNTVPDDEFFDELYSGFNVKRVFVTRMINANADGRGKVSELLITNYE
jgi:DNA adenine methylase